MIESAGSTVKPAPLLVPLVVVTVTFAAPVAALAAMVSVAVIWVALATVTLPAVIAGLPTATVAPATGDLRRIHGDWYRVAHDAILQNLGVAGSRSDGRLGDNLGYLPPVAWFPLEVTCETH